MADTSPFAPFVPGFDFLQGLVSNAGAALPGIGQWVAPTLNPQELEKRIEELRTIQFWLEQNGRMVGATIQALEVQRMTLATLQTMNVQMEDLRDSLKIKPLVTPSSPSPSPSPSAPTAAPSAMRFFGSPAEPGTASPAPSSAAPKGEPGDAKAPHPAAPPPGVDPMQWWGALTQQFTQLATQAMQQGAADVSKHMATLKSAQAAAAPKASDTDTASRTAASRSTPAGKAAKAPPRARPKAKDGKA